MIIKWVKNGSQWKLYIGDKDIAEANEDGSYYVYNGDEDIVSGVELSCYDARAKASLSAINQKLLTT